MELYTDKAEILQAQGFSKQWVDIHLRYIVVNDHFAKMTISFIVDVLMKIFRGVVVVGSPNGSQLTSTPVLQSTSDSVLRVRALSSARADPSSRLYGIKARKGASRVRAGRAAICNSPETGLLAA